MVSELKHEGIEGPLAWHRVPGETPFRPQASWSAGNAPSCEEGKLQAPRLLRVQLHPLAAPTSPHTSSPSWSPRRGLQPIR